MLKTEMRNKASEHIDKMDTLSMVRLINEENMNAVKAVEESLDKIAEVCDAVADCFENGGRLFYIGAGLRVGWVLSTPPNVRPHSAFQKSR